MKYEYIRASDFSIFHLQFKLSHLSLDSHSKDKIRRLLGDRRNDESDVVTLVADRCPLRKQNYDYNQYLLLALFYESWVIIRRALRNAYVTYLYYARLERHSNSILVLRTPVKLLKKNSCK